MHIEKSSHRKFNSAAATRAAALKAVFDGLSERALAPANIQAVARELDAIAIQAATLSAYLGPRGTATGFDEGNAAGDKAAMSMRKRVRKVLGFSYP